jgi:hypothetical protein
VVGDSSHPCPTDRVTVLCEPAATSSLSGSTRTILLTDSSSVGLSHWETSRLGPPSSSAPGDLFWPVMVVGRMVMLAGAALVAAAGFLPWVRTGERERSAFELIDAARMLHVLDSGVVRVLAVAFYFVPFTAMLCWVAVLSQQPRAAAVLAIGTGLLGLLVAIGVETAAVTALSGVRATLVAAVAVIVGGTFELLERRTT